MDQGEAVFAGGGHQGGHPGHVGGPGLAAALGRLGGVHRGVGRGVDHAAVRAEVEPGHRGRVGEIELGRGYGRSAPGSTSSSARPS